MTPQEAAEILKRHNEWRRWDGPGEECPEMQPTKLIGQAIQEYDRHQKLIHGTAGPTGLIYVSRAIRIVAVEVSDD